MRRDNPNGTATTEKPFIYRVRLANWFFRPTAAIRANANSNERETTVAVYSVFANERSIDRSPHSESISSHRVSQIMLVVRSDIYTLFFWGGREHSLRQRRPRASRKTSKQRNYKLSLACKSNSPRDAIIDRRL